MCILFFFHHLPARNRMLLQHKHVSLYWKPLRYSIFRRLCSQVGLSPLLCHSPRFLLGKQTLPVPEIRADGKVFLVIQNYSCWTPPLRCMIGRPTPDCQSVLSGLLALLGISGVMASGKILPFLALTGAVF